MPILIINKHRGLTHFAVFTLKLFDSHLLGTRLAEPFAVIALDVA